MRMESKRLEGKVALVTGAGRGIGRAVSVKFASEGADLFLCATRLETLEETAKGAARYGGKTALYPADVADRAAVERMVGETIEAFGKIDILVNNAGIYKPARFVDYRPEDFDRIMRVNVYGPFHATQFVLRHMIERKAGKVINIASTAGKWASIHQSAYNTSKHALVGMTRCVALEMAPHGINVNAICPGVVETDMVSQFVGEHAEIMGVDEEAVKSFMLQRIPMGRMLQPEEIADLAAYLASGESDGMTGQSILVDGGMLFV
jgi:3-hydroxybutyrate dehydrogenase